MKTNFLRGFTAVLALLLTLLACHNVLLLKSEDGISQCRSLYKQKKDSIDVLFLGSSRIFCNVRTGILWDEYGIASYDLGGAETTMMSSFYHLSEALKTQHPEVVVLEVSVPVLRPTLFPPLFWLSPGGSSAACFSWLLPGSEGKKAKQNCSPGCCCVLQLREP